MCATSVLPSNTAPAKYPEQHRNTAQRVCFLSPLRTLRTKVWQAARTPASFPMVTNFLTPAIASRTHRHTTTCSPFLSAKITSGVLPGISSSMSSSSSLSSSSSPSSTSPSLLSSPLLLLPPPLNSSELSGFVELCMLSISESIFVSYSSCVRGCCSPLLVIFTL